MKYGRSGKPKSRFFYLSKDESILYWKMSNGSKDKPRYIEVKDVNSMNFWLILF